MVRAIQGAVLFKRRASEEVEAVDLRVGTDWSQQHAVAAETVARTRNLCIRCIHISCVACAAPFVALWRDTFNDRMPCRDMQLYMAPSCLLKSDVNWQQLLQPFACSKLGVVRYEFVVYSDACNEQKRAEYDALWAASDGSTTLVSFRN